MGNNNKPWQQRKEKKKKIHISDSILCAKCDSLRSSLYCMLHWKPPSPTSSADHVNHAYHTISHRASYSSCYSILTFQRLEHVLKFRPHLYLTWIILSLMYSIRGSRRCFTRLLLLSPTAFPSHLSLLLLLFFFLLPAARGFSRMLR